MSKLYDDVIADVKKLREVAQQNAQNKVIESIAPRIREMIDKKLQIIPEAKDKDKKNDDILCDEQDKDGDLVESSNPEDDNEVKPIPTPGPVEEVFELTTESLRSLLNIYAHEQADNKRDAALLETSIAHACENSNRIVKACSSLLAEGQRVDYDAYDKAVEGQRAELLEHFQNLSYYRNEMDDVIAERLAVKLEVANARLSNHVHPKAIQISKYLREIMSEAKKMKSGVINCGVRDTYKRIMALKAELKTLREGIGELKATESIRNLEVSQLTKEFNNTLKETNIMSNKILTEEELKLQFSVAGLPDDFDPAALELNYLGPVEDEGDEFGGDEFDMGADAGGEEMPDFGDMGDDEGMGGDMPDEEEPLELEGMIESLDGLEDDTVIEIDEGTLRRELRRIAEMRNDAPPPGTEGGVADSVLDDFGGGTPDKEFLSLDDDITGDGVGGHGPKVREGRQGKRTVNEARNNRVLRHQLAEVKKTSVKLRKQLVEMNLFNAKLLYANKVLQNEGLSASAKKSTIKSLDKAKTLREVKLLYTGLVEASANKSGKQLTESAKRRGGGSRATQSGGTNGGTQIARWAELAGI